MFHAMKRVCVCARAHECGMCMSVVEAGAHFFFAQKTWFAAIRATLTK